MPRLFNGGASMEFHLTIGTIVLGAIGVSCILLSGLFLYQEIGEVNRKLSEDQQISYYWMYSEKYSKIRDEYRRLYPGGQIHRLQFCFR